MNRTIAMTIAIVLLGGSQSLAVDTSSGRRMADAMTKKLRTYGVIGRISAVAAYQNEGKPTCNLNRFNASKALMYLKDWECSPEFNCWNRRPEEVRRSAYCRVSTT